MKNVIVGTLFAVAASSLGGCIFTTDDTGDGFCGDGFRDSVEACDDGNNTSGDGCSATCASEGATYLTTANWSFANIADNGATTPTACPGGQFDTAAVISQAVDANGAPIGNCGANSPSGTCYVDLYDCVALTGTETLPAGEYLQWVAITNTDGSQTYASSTSAYVTIAGNTTYSAVILNDGGYFQFAWELRNAANTSIACADVAGEDGVAALSTLTGPDTAFDDAFDCEDGFAISGGLPDGSYSLDIAIINAQNQALGTSPLLTNKTIGVQNEITDLGTVTITLN